MTDDIGKQFDKQVQDSFGGIGNERTLLSGTWTVYLSYAITFLGCKWQVAACWQEADRIIATLADDEYAEWMIGVGVESISLNRALEIIATEMWRNKQHSMRYAKEMSDIVPANVVCKALWYELWQYGREGEYEALGGLYAERRY